MLTLMGPSKHLELGWENCILTSSLGLFFFLILTWGHVYWFQRERKEERERNIDCLPPLCTPTRNRTQGTCPDWGSNPPPFGVWDNAPTNWATRPGLQAFLDAYNNTSGTIGQDALSGSWCYYNYRTELTWDKHKEVSLDKLCFPIPFGALLSLQSLVYSFLYLTHHHCLPVHFRV